MLNSEQNPDPPRRTQQTMIVVMQLVNKKFEPNSG
jgi:hypothetical protein